MPTPATVLQSLGSAIYSSPPRSQCNDIDSSAMHAIARALTIPPIHVDHVAQAICVAIEDPKVSGVLGVKELRGLVGWADSNGN